MLNEIKFSELLEIYENKLSKTVKNKRKLYYFERNKMTNLYNIYLKMKEGNWKIEHYNIFLIYEPKCRVVMSLNITDKIINHYINYKILVPKLEKDLDFRNVATELGNKLFMA